MPVPAVGLRDQGSPPPRAGRSLLVARAASFPPQGLGERIWVWPFPRGIAGEGGQARRHTTSPGRVSPLPLLPASPHHPLP